MKAGISIIIILLVLLGAVILKARESAEKVSTTEISVLRDLTDTVQTIPVESEITSLFDLENSKWDGGKFRFINITDISHNHIYEISVNPENEWMGNEFEREKKIKAFYSNISSIFKTALSEPVGKPSSSIYIPIANALNSLRKSPAQTKILLVYSDLIENTTIFSLYKRENMDLLKTNPDSIKQLFEKEVSIGNLKGIKVYLIYQPINNQTDEEVV